MSAQFNVDEILSMAVRVEQNGQAFYRLMAELHPEHRDFLTHLADEEIKHEAFFESLRDDCKTNAGDYHDPDDTGALYIASIADSIIFTPIEVIEDQYSGAEPIERVIDMAIQREKDSVAFFEGAKKILLDEKALEGISRVIEEEMTHTAWLMEKRNELIQALEAEASGKVYDLLVVGAGPSGVSCAAEAIESGMPKEKVLLLEEAGRNSWIIRKLYPEQKLVTANYKGNDPVCNGVTNMRNMTKTDALSMLNSTIIDYDMRVMHEAKVHAIEKKEDGLIHVTSAKGVFRAKICAVGIGVFGKPNKPSYRIPAALRKKTSFDVTSNKVENSDVMVVGGGDSSSEYVIVLLDWGNKVTLVSREDDLRYMNEDNRARILRQAESGEIKLHAGVMVEGLEELEDSDERIKVNYEGDLASETVDHIIYALGGTTPMNFLALSGVEIENNKPVLSEGNETGVPNLYLVGDLAAKDNAGAIVHAFNSSVTAVGDMKTQNPELFD